MTAVKPVEFTRDVSAARSQQRCGNRVQLEDGDGAAIATGNPLPVDVATQSQAADADVSAPAANTAATITKAAPGAGQHNVLACIYWSYDDAPTGGNLTVTEGATEILNVDVTTGGPGFLPLNPPRRFADNTAITATLAAGGAGISGKVSLYAWVE